MQKILVADDEPLNLTLHVEMLSEEGYEIIQAVDGEEAISKAFGSVPDLVLLDWSMPKKDGLQVLRELKKNEATCTVPVIMITGVMNSSRYLSLALEEGATDFLRKPFDKLELVSRVRNTMLLARTLRDLQEKYKIIEDNNNFVESLIERVPHPLVYYNLDGMVIRCNHLFEELAGSTQEELAGKLVYRYFQSREAFLHLQKDMELAGNPGETTYEAKSGQDDRDYIFSKNVYYDATGKVAGIVCILTDLTEIKRSHEMELENKKRELVSSALRLINISEINSNLIAELTKLSVHVDEKGKKIITGLLQQNSITSADGVWQDFEARFEHVYESFYNRLNEKFPDLTPGEKKLCALLRLNISSKDIAAITLHNPQSVDMARYRLRKKLGLRQDENLVDFLIKFDQ